MYLVAYASCLRLVFQNPGYSLCVSLTVRLIDKEGFSQEECAGYMQVARTTVQQIYNTARTKIADALVDGIGIRIDGGEYSICDGKEKHCGCGGCQRHRNRTANK